MRAAVCLSKKGNFVCEVRKIALLCCRKGALRETGKRLHSTKRLASLSG